MCHGAGWLVMLSFRESGSAHHPSRGKLGDAVRRPQCWRVTGKEHDKHSGYCSMILLLNAQDTLPSGLDHLVAPRRPPRNREQRAARDPWMRSQKAVTGPAHSMPNVRTESGIGSAGCSRQTSASPTRGHLRDGGREADNVQHGQGGAVNRKLNCNACRPLGQTKA